VSRRNPGDSNKPKGSGVKGAGFGAEAMKDWQGVREKDVPPAGCGLFSRGCGEIRLIYFGEGNGSASGKRPRNSPTVLLLHWRKRLPLSFLAPRFKAGVPLDVARGRRACAEAALIQLPWADRAWHLRNPLRGCGVGSLAFARGLVRADPAPAAAGAGRGRLPSSL
jgi:hypothetical protein